MANHLALCGVGNSGSGGGGGGGGTPVDLLIRFENGADEAAVTPTILTNASLATAAGAGTWTVPFVAPKIDTAQEIDITGVNVSGAGNSDAGSTRAMRSDVAADQTFARFALTTTCPIATIGFAFRHNFTASTFNYYTIVSMNSGIGDYTAFHCRDFAPCVCSVETIAGTDEAHLITLAANTWYWITMRFNRTAASATMRVYNPSTWAQIGSDSTQTMDGTTNLVNVEFGRQDDHGVFGAQATWIDDLAVSLSTGTGATWPLLPT